MKSQSVVHFYLISSFIAANKSTYCTVKLGRKAAKKKKIFSFDTSNYNNCMSTKGKRTTKTNLIILATSKKEFTEHQRSAHNISISSIEINDNARFDYQDDKRQ